MRLEPRYYQKDAFEAFLSYTTNNPGKHPLIVLPTGCLAEDTIIYNSGKEKTIEQMYKAFNSRSTPTFVRSFYDGEIKRNEINGVMYSGIKDLYLLELENGLSIKATACHKFLTTSGWKRLDSLELKKDAVMIDSVVFLKNFPSYASVKKISYFGKGKTYDISCIENHNFVANGMVVHNSGKSLVIANIIEEVMKYSGTRVLMLTHQKHLIRQNYAEFIENTTIALPDAGIYSAGLKSRETRNRVLFAGIQSVHDKPYHLGAFDLILIDEAHRVPHKTVGTYRKFLAACTQINPAIVIAGLTATAYRLKGGVLTEGEEKLFDDICHETSVAELIDPEHPKNRDKKRYLSPLKSKQGKASVDTSSIRTQGSGAEKEFVLSDMQAAFDVDYKVKAAIKETVEFMEGRKKIIVFASGIEHCKHIEIELQKYGKTVGVVHSQKPDSENDNLINDFKQGKLNYLCNIGVLTTGFNEKAIDGITLLHSTLSPGLYVQEVGRGLRLHPDKEDCLVLDFGHNIERHGAIDKIEVRKNYSTGSNEVNSIPQKACPQCQNFSHARALECIECGYVFPVEGRINHDITASTASIISERQPPVEVEVKNVFFERHKGKNGKPDSLRVDYSIAISESYSEWVCIEHEGYARQKALTWIRRRCAEDIRTIDDAIKNFDKFTHPSKIMVDLNEKFPRVTAYCFDPPLILTKENSGQLTETELFKMEELSISEYDDDLAALM